MGRRGVAVGERGRWVFDRLAVDYRARPPYPPPLLDLLASLATAPAPCVVDLGAGTGLLALPLAARGLPVQAVEPAAAMLAELRAGAGGLPVRPVHAAAEETGLPTGEASLVTLADALQWVDPARTGCEAARLLGPGGVLAVVEPRLGGSPFADGLVDLVAGANPRARPRPAGRLEQLFDAAGVRTRQAEILLDEATLEPERLDAVLRSLSLVGPALGPERLAALLSDARALADRCGGARWTRTIRVTWGRAEERRSRAVDPRP